MSHKSPTFSPPSLLTPAQTTAAVVCTSPSASSTSTHPNHDQSVTLPEDVLTYLDRQAYLVARQLQSLSAQLQAQMHDMTQSTLASVETHAMAVENFDAQAKATIDKATQLISECDQLNAEMAPIYALAEQIRSIHRMLDVLEQQLK
jgi:hypothetical protein